MTQFAISLIDLNTLAFKASQSVPPAHIALVTETPGRDGIALAAELAQFSELPISRFAVHTAIDLEKDIALTEAVTVIISIEDSFGEDDWRYVDQNRSRFLKPIVLVLVVNKESVKRIFTIAPNYASHLGGSVFAITSIPEMSDADRELRLRDLRRWSNLTDDEVVVLAQHGNLPADPSFAEWLVLLDKGDLLND